MATILALDLAGVTGWAVGEPGGVPSHGSVRFASLGSCHEAVFAAALKWMSDICVSRTPDLVVWEAPLAPIFKRGNSNDNTTTVLYGLPAIIGAVAYLRGVYDIRKAGTRDVRMHFIGKNLKRVQAKIQTKLQCQAMGWDVADDNEADALATWHYMCSLIEPRLALRPTPLFARRA